MLNYPPKLLKLSTIPSRHWPQIPNGKSCMDELQTPDFTKIDFDTLVEIAEKGDQLAQYRVGLIYCIGDGITKDLPKAAEWWIRSSKQGNENAQFCLLNFCHFLNIKGP